MKSWKPRQPRGSGRKKTNPRSDWFFIRGGGVGSSTTTRFINSWVTVGKDEGVWPPSPAIDEFLAALPYRSSVPRPSNSDTAIPASVCDADD